MSPPDDNRSLQGELREPEAAVTPSPATDVPASGAPVPTTDAPIPETDAPIPTADAPIPTADTAVADAPASSQLSRTNLALGLVAGVTIIAALYLGRNFFVPLLIGILGSYALTPVVESLMVCRIPRALAAALVLAVLVAGMTWVADSLSEDIAAMSEKLPEAARKLRQRISAASASGSPSALQNVQQAAKEIEGAAATVVGANPTVRPLPPRPPESSSWLSNYMIAQSAALFAFAAQTPIVLLLIYFLLASGEHFRRKLVKFVGPSLSRKKDAVRILEEIEVQVKRYLLAMVVTNLLIAVATWLAFEALGVEEAGIWGVAAGILHFIPYLGPAFTALASGIAAFLQFDSMLDAVIVGGASLVVAGVIGMGFMTWLQGRLASVNSAVLFIALLFFAWLWGVWGLLLGAPLVAIAKAICDHVESLKSVGELLGR